MSLWFQLKVAPDSACLRLPQARCVCRHLLRSSVMESAPLSLQLYLQWPLRAWVRHYSCLWKYWFNPCTLWSAGRFSKRSPVGSRRYAERHLKGWWFTSRKDGLLLERTNQKMPLNYMLSWAQVICVWETASKGNCFVCTVHIPKEVQKKSEPQLD